MTTPYGISEDILKKEWFTCFHPSLFMKLKFWLFGRKIVEYVGMQKVVWYVYKDQLFLVEMKHKYL